MNQSLRLEEYKNVADSNFIDGLTNPVRSHRSTSLADR